MVAVDSLPSRLGQAGVLFVAILVFQLIARGELTLSIAVGAIVGFVIVSLLVDSV